MNVFFQFYSIKLQHVHVCKYIIFTGTGYEHNLATVEVHNFMTS